MFGKKLMAKAAKPMMFAGALAAIAAVQPAQAAVTTYSVSQMYNQVYYDNPSHHHPEADTFFNGSFTYDDATHTVSGLSGTLSQAMTTAMGMTEYRNLSYQLSSVRDQVSGTFLVSTFFQNTTNVFSGGGFATGGMNTFGNQNAYATIFFDPSNPVGTLVNNLAIAYGDCTDGSLMGGNMCMTGWVKNVGGTLSAGGTMGGTFPVTQTIAAVPEPESYAMLLAGLGLLGFLVRRRKAS